MLVRVWCKLPSKLLAFILYIWGIFSGKMKSAKINFIASVDEDSIDEIKLIAKKLKSLGCSINHILTFSGIITGSTTSNISIDDLKIDGIKSIELDRAVKALNK